jgi:hypothetical protein
MNWETLREVLYGLVPTAGVLLIFSLVVRAILRADSAERRAAQEYGAADAGPSGSEAADPTGRKASDGDT